MAESGSGSSNSTIDSYIGSLISLTSKSEIRYEGILYTADEKDSTIALQSVRSFGTEGRKKDGPQIPPSEKVYEYIIFRASDIKDLFVKSPPSTQTSQIHSDPAIISLQSQYSQQSSAAPKSYGPSVSAPQPDPSSLSGNAGVQSTNFRGASPLLPTPRNLGTWGSTPVPGNGAGFAMPMYWQGYYGPTSGLMPHMQQQPLHYHSPPGIPIPPGLQQNVQQNQVPSSMPMGLSPSEFNAFQNAATAQRSIEAANPTGPIPGPMTVPATTSSTLAASNPVSLQNHIQSNDLKTTLSATVPVVSSGQDSNFIGNPSATKSVNVSISASTIQSIPQTVAASVPSLGTSGQPNLVTPGQLLQTGTSSTARNKPLANGTEESDRSKLQSKSSTQVASDSHSQRASNQPLLPLPTSSTQHRASHQVNGMVGHSGQHSGLHSGQYSGQYSGHHSGYHQRRRGRAIDRGGRHATSRFTEDFDFIAMNEKFNKDEVWGHLGKVESQDGIEDGEEDNSIEREGDETRQTSAAKPVYVKDDFFDTLSCEALDRSRNDRRFSEQRKLDSETFGSLSRSRGRGRGSGYRGNYRGSYYGGRGNGYGGRGRGGGRTYY